MKRNRLILAAVILFEVLPVYCRVFDVSSDDERNFYILDLEEAEAKDLTECKAPLMKTVEATALSTPAEEDPPVWF